MGSEVKLNLGSCFHPIDGYVNIDKQERCNPDVLMDILDGLPWKDSTVDVVRAFDFLEHVPIGKTIFVIEEIYRILKPNGMFEHFTPSTDGRGAFQDPTHLSFWNVNSWLYYTEDSHRNLYGIQAKFSIIRLNDMITDNDKHIIHTYGLMNPIK